MITRGNQPPNVLLLFIRARLCFVNLKRLNIHDKAKQINEFIQIYLVYVPENELEQS